MRGRSHIGNPGPSADSFWRWRDDMYAYVQQMTANQFYDVCRTTFTEMMANGITTVGEFHYFHHSRPIHSGTPDDGQPYDFDRVILAAAKDVGIRIVLLETLYETGGLVGETLSMAQRRFVSLSMEEFWGNFDKIQAETVNEPTQTVGVAAHSVRAVTYENLLKLRYGSLQRGVPFHMHLEEQPKKLFWEIDDSISAYGKRPMDIVLEQLKPDETFTAVHATYTTGEGVKALIETKANICICPLTEGDGVPNLPQERAIESHPTYCLGSDCNNRLCLLEEGRLFAYCQQMKHNKRGISSLHGEHLAHDLLTMATDNGARSLGLQDRCGRLEPGYYFDCFSVDLHHRTLTDVAVDGIVDALFFSGASDAVVKNVCVGGVMREVDDLSVAAIPKTLTTEPLDTELNGATLEDFLVSLMSIESTTGNEGRLAEKLATYLGSNGWHTQLQPLSSQPDRYNVLATKVPLVHGSLGPSIIFNSHLDTVPPYIPPSSESGIIRGRGSNDAKGQVAAMVFAANKIYDENPELGKQIGLLFVADEEYTHLGIKEANAYGLKPSILVVGEPTELKFALCQKGALKVKISCKGIAAHSGYPHMGKSALEPLLDILHDLRHTTWPKNNRLGETTMNIGRMKAGHALNALPAAADAEIFFRLVTDSQTVLQQLTTIVDERATIEVSGTSDPVELETLTGYPTGVACFNTDIPYFVHDKNDTKVFLFGAGSITDAHSDWEFVRTDELHKAVVAYCDLVRSLAAV